MTHVIHLTHWLDEDGWPVPAVRRRALRIARLVEYGGPIAVGYSRETLVECSRRVNRVPCDGLLWVVKVDGSTIEAYCPSCDRERYVITGWLTTTWADGPMEPLPPRSVSEPPADSN